MTRRVIGIDPGSINTGYGIIDMSGNRMTRVTSGTIACGKGAFSDRLTVLYDALKVLCEEYSPSEGAIEGIFHHKNASSALKLGHARGVALLALSHAEIPTSEYQPRVVKKSVVGYGAADKTQVATMVMRLLQLKKAGGHDETDALAIAVCHLHQSRAIPKRTL